MMDKNFDERLKEIFKLYLKDGKLSCTDTFEIHHKWGISLKDIGKAADDLKIKIIGCQLGCF
jgi:hypothetical protein